MKKLTFKAPGGKPLLDIVSHGRGGPGSLTPAQMEHIRRTVRRVPEVMVKVLSRGGQDLTSVGKHLHYIGRDSRLPLETDDDGRLFGQTSERLLEDWDLDLEDKRRRNDLAPTSARKLPKLVYKIMFSMPKGTPPEKVREAVRNFAREEFALKHRYAFVLHTDEPHPHVHMVVKAMSEEGTRLNVRKATLRRWRSDFAKNLRELGVPANATERAVRGNDRKASKDGIYRAAVRGNSTFMRARVEVAARTILRQETAVDKGQDRLVATRRDVERGWRSVAQLLNLTGEHELARDTQRHLEQMPPPCTEMQWIALSLHERMRGNRVREKPQVR